MIKTTIEKVVNSIDVFRELSKMPIKARSAYTIARLIQELENELRLYNEQKFGIIEKYGVKDDSGQLLETESGQYKIEPDKIEECNKELFSLLSTEITLLSPKLVLDDIGEVEITPAQMVTLLDFME